MAHNEMIPIPHDHLNARFPLNEEAKQPLTLRQENTSRPLCRVPACSEEAKIATSSWENVGVELPSSTCGQICVAYPRCYTTALNSLTTYTYIRPDSLAIHTLLTSTLSRTLGSDASVTFLRHHLDIHPTYNLRCASTLILYWNILERSLQNKKRL